MELPLGQRASSELPSADPATMIDGEHPLAMLDACVLYPSSIRDLLMRLAVAGMFRPLWTSTILNEMVSSVLRQRPDLTEQRLGRTIQRMAQAYPAGMVTGYEHRIADLELPDPADRHVVAAAMHAGCGLIVTDNSRDFPVARLQSLGLETATADSFLNSLVVRQPAKILDIVGEQADALQQPRLDRAGVLGSLERAGLVDTASSLREAAQQ